MRRSSYSSTPKLPLTHDDMIVLRILIQEAVDSIKDEHVHKDARSFDGEAYTHMRRLAKFESEGVKRLFGSGMKSMEASFHSLKPEQQEILKTMYDHIKAARKEQREDDSITIMKQAILGAQASVKKATELAGRSEQVGKRLEHLRRVIDGEETND